MRRILLTFALGLIGALAFGFAPAPEWPGPALKPPSPEEMCLRELLAKVNAWGGLEQDKEITLSKALEELAKNSKWRGVTFRIDGGAFKRADIVDVGEVLIVGEKGIEGGTMSLKLVLKKILERVPVEGGEAVSVLRRDAIEITTTTALRDEVWGKGHPGPFLPLVHATFTKHPLRAVLQELADQHDCNILLERRVAPRDKTKVSAEFCNVPLDNAVKFLARQAGLHVASIESGLYVTSTRTEAEAIAKRQREKRAQTRREQRQDWLDGWRESLRPWQRVAAVCEPLGQFNGEWEGGRKAKEPGRAAPKR